MSSSVAHDNSVANCTIIGVVDGDRAVRDGVKSLIETLGVTVKTFESAEQFLSDIDHQRIDCLITALELPGMSGLELLEWMERHGRTVPTILLASDGDVQTAVNAMRAGAVDFLEKPFVDRALLEHLQAIFGEDS